MFITLVEAIHSIRTPNPDGQFTSNNGSFHGAISSVLVMAQLFGVMPVIGIKSDSATKLRFKWNSIRTVYSIVMFIALGIMFTTLIFRFIWRQEFKFSKGEILIIFLKFLN